MCGAGDQWLKQTMAGATPPPANRERRALIIFIRKPELGKVKTRLAATIGDAAALAAYRDMLAHTRAVALETDCDRYLFYNGAVETDDEWEPAHFKKYLQPEGDLGQKMRAAFQQVFAEGHDKALIIGSDCLDLRPSHLTTTYRMLAITPVAFGPASDGGYYLLGLREDIPALFEGIAWSTDRVLKESRAILDAQGRSYSLGETLHDIDTEADYRAALLRNPQARV
jgi:uncharacterized protein